ncbi:HNH endonuclease [Mycobacterium stomatepiae]|uniref:HNH nuclease domain-containing protein n=1 Tax=Mycobacterium stomatepiae TaxID=470076 RepID=A0A7I7QAS1_9MYCO|nr:HNH endonuclease signature motif containing protein [Mycobacterium stomatepiae]MCV7163786.1 HNH endonuclease [Mycobacterium stomatepiae]BBY23261.1 hypothetical protein MSTO_34660 [Mycobacterium stomatepiae]
MRVIGIAAAAAIALAPFSVLATAAGVAQAAPVAQYRIPTGPTLPTPTDYRDAGADPTGHSANSSAPEYNSDGHAEEDTSPSWWPSALHYGVLMTAVGLAAWAIGLSSHRAAGTPRIRPRPERRRAPSAASTVRPAPAFPTIDPPDSETKRRVLVEAAHRCAIPTCRRPTTEIAHIVSESQRRGESFENLITLCPDCQEKEIDPRSIRMYKRNLGILNSRYSDFERRLFDQIAETGRTSFVVQAGLEIPLLHAVNDGILKQVELSPVPAQRGEPIQYRYEVVDAGLDFVGRYMRGEDIS